MYATLTSVGVLYIKGLKNIYYYFTVRVRRTTVCVVNYMQNNAINKGGFLDLGLF